LMEKGVYASFYEIQFGRQIANNTA